MEACDLEFMIHIQTWVTGWTEVGGGSGGGVWGREGCGKGRRPYNKMRCGGTVVVIQCINK